MTKLFFAACTLTLAATSAWGLRIRNYCDFYPQIRR